jgi:hypothetical protein
MIAFLKRGEKRLRKAFADYNLVPTLVRLLSQSHFDATREKMPWKKA